MLNEQDIEDIQIQLLKLGKAIDSGQASGDLLALVAETLDILRIKKKSVA